MNVTREATFSDDGVYRYTLGRSWSAGEFAAAPGVLFVMLNPSTADGSKDDPTIRRCIGFARAWGFGSLEVGNLYAFRATFPTDLARAEDSVGPGNDDALGEMASRAKLIVCAWGANKLAHPTIRATNVMALLRRYGDLVCLGRTAKGAPRHPLYVSGDTKPVRYR